MSFSTLSGFSKACCTFLFSFQHVFHLMSSLAWINIGRIDWEEYIPMMYSRFLKIFKLPVHYKKTSSLKMSKISEDSAASWIVSTLVYFFSNL